MLYSIVCSGSDISSSCLTYKVVDTVIYEVRVSSYENLEELCLV